KGQPRQQQSNNQAHRNPKKSARLNSEVVILPSATSHRARRVMVTIRIGDWTLLVFFPMLRVTNTHIKETPMKIRPFGSGLKPVLAALLPAASAPALAGTVTVITSFPKELTNAYKKAFEQANPGITIEILNKNTVSGIAFVRETPAGKRPDVFWASAPDAFEVLAQAGLLTKSTDVANPDVPASIGKFPINNP